MSERDDLIARLKRNGITLIGNGPDGALEDWQVEFAWTGGKDTGEENLRPLRRMCFIYARFLLRDGTEITHWYDGMEIQIERKICGKCGKAPEDHWRNIVYEVPGGQRTVMTCTTGQGEYVEAEDGKAGNGRDDIQTPGKDMLATVIQSMEKRLHEEHGTLDANLMTLNESCAQTHLVLDWLAGLRAVQTTMEEEAGPPIGPPMAGTDPDLDRAVDLASDHEEDAAG